MNIKTAKFWQHDQKIGFYFFLCTYFYVIVEYTYPTRGEWRDPAPAKIDTSVGYIPTNRPTKTKARVAPETQPTTGFFHGCRALVTILKEYLLISRKVPLIGLQSTCVQLF